MQWIQCPMSASISTDPVGSSLLWALYVRKAMIPDFYGTECLVSYNKPVSKI